MQWLLLLPCFLGLSAVLQASLNRQMARAWPLPYVMVLNSLVNLVAAICLVCLVRAYSDSFAEIFRLRSRGFLAENFPIRAWYLLPGLFGFCLVAGIPFAISRLGAFTVFLAVISGQLLTSLAWDIWVEGMPITWIRALGAVLVLISAAMVSWK